MYGCLVRRAALIYTHTFQKNEFVLSWKKFYLKSVNFLFLLSIVHHYINRLLVVQQIPTYRLLNLIYCRSRGSYLYRKSLIFCSIFPDVLLDMRHVSLEEELRM